MPAGPEFVLADAQEPHLFVIRRQLRGAPGAAPVPQAVYYILDGSVYQAPTLEAVLLARLVREGGGLGFFFFVLPFRPSSPSPYASRTASIAHLPFFVSSTATTSARPLPATEMTSPAATAACATCR